MIGVSAVSLGSVGLTHQIWQSESPLISLNTILIVWVNFDFVGQGLKVLTTQSAHPVRALVAATDATRA